MSVDEIKERLLELGHEGTVVLEQPDYANAVIGVSQDGRLIYDFDLMVEHLRPEMSAEEAIEFIEYNTIRALPYMGEKAPLVCYKLREGEPYE